MMAEIISMPKLGFDMAEGTLMRWLRAEGEEIQKGEILAEIETDKATVEVESSYTGLVHRLLVDQGDSVPVGTPIAVIAAPGEDIKEDLTQPGQPAERTAKEAAQPETDKKPVDKTPDNEATANPEMMRASPLARRMAMENRLDLSKIQGSGPGGRIVRKDIEAALKVGTPAIAAEKTQAPQKGSLPMATGQGRLEALEDRVIPVQRLRAAIGRRMVEAKQELPHFYVTHEYDMEWVLGLRKQLNNLLPEEEKVSINDFIIKATALSLREYRNLNASLEGEQILQHGAINIGVAVAVEGGLLTVVVRGADLKPIRQIAAEVKAMAARARLGKVRPDDIEGSTFSISNLGMFNVENFAAIINPPEAAILAVSSVRPVTVVVDGKVEIRQRMKATLSADHRITDGAEAALFLQALEKALEEPLGLLI